MNETKKWWQSKTIWLALIAAASQIPNVGEHIGAIDPDTLSGTVEGVLSIISVIAGSSAAVTRGTATEKISSEPVRRG